MDTAKTSSVLKKVYWGLWSIYIILTVIIMVGSRVIDIVEQENGIGLILWLTMTFLLGAIPNVYSFNKFLHSDLRIGKIGLVLPYGIIFLVLHTFIILDLINWLSFEDAFASIIIGVFGFMAIILGLIINVIVMVIVRKRRNKTLINKK